MRSLDSLSLRELLDICSEPSGSLYQAGWAQLHDRFGGFIHEHVKRNCFQFRDKRLSLQRSEVAEDIEFEVYLVLYRNDCRVLKNFFYRDNEQKFKAFLRRICRNTSLRLLLKYFPPILSDIPDEDFIPITKSYVSDLEQEQVKEVYQVVVKICRDHEPRSNLERDLSIFLVLVFGDFSEAMLREHPCFKALGHRVVQNATYRIRKVLRKYGDLLK